MDPAPTPPTDCPFVSRGGLKLDHALTQFSLDPRGEVAADFGCSTGGFTDCLLQRGAARVFAIDTAYGQLAWRLRNDPRVVVMERTNALHAPPPPELVDLIVADAGWTPQRLLLPAAGRWLKPSGVIVSLLKPHYEIKDLGQTLPRGGVLDDAQAEEIARATVRKIESAGFTVRGFTMSPIRGGQKAGKEKSQGGGNAEWLVLVEPAAPRT